MILRTPNQELMARLLAAEERKGKLALTPSRARSALVGALLSQNYGLSGLDALPGGIESFGLDFLEALRKKRKKKPQVLTLPQPAPTTLGP